MIAPLCIGTPVLSKPLARARGKLNTPYYPGLRDSGIVDRDDPKARVVRGQRVPMYYVAERSQSLCSFLFRLFAFIIMLYFTLLHTYIHPWTLVHSWTHCTETGRHIGKVKREEKASRQKV
jgi:hypothetical protein